MQENFDFSGEAGSGSDNQGPIENDQPLETSSHFWVVADDYFNSTLILTPSGEGEHQHQIKVYDATGQMVNKLQLTFPAGKPGVFDLNAALGDCKVVAGLVQAHVEVVSWSPTQHRCYLTVADKQALVSPAVEISRSKAGFFPLQISNQSKNTLTFCNKSMPDAHVRCRLYTGTRAPEIEIKVPAYGAAVVNIEQDFEEYLNLSSSRQTQAYLRIVSNSSAELAVTLIEKKYPRSINLEEME